MLAVSRRGVRTVRHISHDELIQIRDDSFSWWAVDVEYQHQRSTTKAFAICLTVCSRQRIQCLVNQTTSADRNNARLGRFTRRAAVRNSDLFEDEQEKCAVLDKWKDKWPMIKAQQEQFTAEKEADNIGKRLRTG
jgi:hypothetical protein